MWQVIIGYQPQLQFSLVIIWKHFVPNLKIFFKTDSLNVVKMLENKVFDRNCFLFTIDFKSLYTNISVKDAIKLMKILFFKYQNVIPNSHFIMELMELVLNSAVMKFQEDFFLQILGIVMGTNLAPIFANIYMAILEEELYIRCKNKIWNGLKCTNDLLTMVSASSKATKKNLLNGFLNSIAKLKISL